MEISLGAVVAEAIERGYKLDNIVFSDIEICANCKIILFADDEAYSSYNGKDALCDSCSVKCDECESYMCDNDSMQDGNGYSVCPNCASTESGEADV